MLLYGNHALRYRVYVLLRQFLYPSEEDSFKLIRFLVERLSESSKGGTIGDRSDVKNDEFESYLEYCIEEESDENGVDVKIQKVEAQLNDLRLVNEAEDSLNTKGRDASFSRSNDVNLVVEKIGNRDSDGVLSRKNSAEEPLGIGRDEGAFSAPEQIVTSLADQSSKVRFVELRKFG